MSTRFVNGNYITDSSGLGQVPLWQQYGYPTKAACKQAGRAACGLPPSSSPAVPPPSAAIAPVPVSQAPVAVGTPATSNGGVLSGVEGFFSGIPTTYLLIGGAIIAVMLLKKR